MKSAIVHLLQLRMDKCLTEQFWAVAALLARGLPLAEAVAAAKRWLSAAIAAGAGLGVGTGIGPVHHFHALWPLLAGTDG